jgi:hypothetical protein
MQNMFYFILISVNIDVAPNSFITLTVLAGPGIEFRWMRDFQHLCRPTLRPNHPPIQSVPGLSRE